VEIKQSERLVPDVLSERNHGVAIVRGMAEFLL
jgi:hypothetical protein